MVRTGIALRPRLECAVRAIDARAVLGPHRDRRIDVRHPQRRWSYTTPSAAAIRPRLPFAGLEPLRGSRRAARGWRQYVALQVPHGLIDDQANRLRPFRFLEANGINVRINGSPLAGPVIAHGRVPLQPATFPRIGPFDIRTHQCDHAVDVSGIELRVRFTKNVFRVPARCHLASLAGFHRRDHTRADEFIEQRVLAIEVGVAALLDRPWRLGAYRCPSSRRNRNKDCPRHSCLRPRAPA